MRDQPPTMMGFTWTGPASPSSNPALGDNWCMRDALCKLFGWPVGSKEWHAFIEGPGPADMDRLLDHLGLKWYDPEYDPHWSELAELLDHPGIILYKSRQLRVEHALYEPHLRHIRGLPPIYWNHAPDWELFQYIPDVRQEPHFLS